MDAKLKHLEFIQNVISRMSQCSFQARGFSVVIVAALLGLDASRDSASMVRVALIPAAVMWILDGFYLSQERQFRKLYDHVRGLADREIDFGMNTTPHSTWRQGWLASTFSRTVLLLHGAVIGAVLLTLCFA